MGFAGNSLFMTDVGTFPNPFGSPGRLPDVVMDLKVAQS